MKPQRHTDHRLLATLATLLLAITTLPTTASAGPDDGFIGRLAAPDRQSNLRLDLDTSLLWRATNSTPLNYTTLASSLTLSSPTRIEFDLGTAHVAVHHSISLLADSFLDGAENYYVGIAGSPILVLTPSPDSRLQFLFSAGGGVGWTDSAGSPAFPNAQGQDLTFNWFIRTGIRYRITQNISLNATAHYQHLSNTGQSPTNPGLDSLGPSLGLSWKF